MVRMVRLTSRSAAVFARSATERLESLRCGRCPVRHDPFHRALAIAAEKTGRSGRSRFAEEQARMTAAGGPWSPVRRLRCPRVTSDRWDRAHLDASQRLGVNFQLARHRIEAFHEYAPSVRARALAAYVGVFDFADDDGWVDASSDELAKAFGISRVSWLQYRALLEKARLVEVDARHGGVRRRLRLSPPASDVRSAASDRSRFPLR
jgi:hypothetical protein